MYMNQHTKITILRKIFYRTNCFIKLVCKIGKHIIRIGLFGSGHFETRHPYLYAEITLAEVNYATKI